MTTVLDRFLRYVRYDTQSDEQSKTYPSTGEQLVLLRDLARELRDLGLADAEVDEHGYVIIKDRSKDIIISGDVSTWAMKPIVGTAAFDVVAGIVAMT